MRTEKRCPACGLIKSTNAWPRNNARHDGLGSRCSQCHTDAYGATHTKQRAEAMRRLRAEAERLYGGVCVVCGTSVRLEFDHVRGDGGKHRTWERVQQMYRRIVHTGKPLDDVELQLLCHTHHWEKTRSSNETRTHKTAT